LRSWKAFAKRGKPAGKRKRSCSCSSCGLLDNFLRTSVPRSRKPATVRAWSSGSLSQRRCRRWTISAATGVSKRTEKERQRWQQAREGLDVIKSPFMESLRAEGQAKAVVKILDARFPGQVYVEVRTMIEKTRAWGLLDEWVRLAATAASLDSFCRDSGLWRY